MNRFNRNDILSRAGDDSDEDEERLYERQALIFEDNNDICDEEINSGHVVMRHRQQLDKDRLRNEINGYELRSYNSRTYKDSNENNTVEFTYYDIQPGDSLQSICLRYACPINQVRRLNRLMTDQDFYGLRRLKLPLGKFGLLEDLLKQQQPQQNGSQDLLALDDGAEESRPRLVNSPGSALSVANIQNSQRFKPLLSPGYSSDKINELNSVTRIDKIRTNNQTNPTTEPSSLRHNSHSYSSIGEFSNGDTNINISSPEAFHPAAINNTKLPQHSFIKSEIVPDPGQVTIDNLLIDEQPAMTNVFEDLDYHVERAKAAAESYEQRATELVSGIELTGAGVRSTGHFGPRPSRIPELFFSGENFGLNIKRLVMLICFVCLVIPLVYISQAKIV